MNHLTTLVLALALQTEWFQTKYVLHHKVSRTDVLLLTIFIIVS
jgi:hypothetical protein